MSGERRLVGSCVWLVLAVVGCRMEPPNADAYVLTEAGGSSSTGVGTTSSGESGGETEVEPTGSGGLEAVCGNGVVEEGEDCDDEGESVACDADCTVAVCGDGLANAAAGESCDDGGESAACNSNCTTVMCGDGVTNVTAGEECDDAGESMSCDADCSLAVCGDGLVNATANEECDAMGETALCDVDCTEVICGDGTTNVTAGEGCDDGGESALCDADCTAADCGDGVLNMTAGETCDDGGESMVCDVDCTPAMCGDGVFNATFGEECDSGGPTMACDGDCTLVSCGDGLTNVPAGEECDDGGESTTCNSNCTTSACGDGITNVTALEACDDMGDSLGCDGDCTPVDCGDGYVNATAAEACDDVGESATCDADCTPVECGDGVINAVAGEVCEGADLAGETCASQGFGGGGLACDAAGCTLDTSGCYVLPPGMVEVPGGVFEMGSNAIGNAQPVRMVEVDGFWMDEAEVTVAEYAACEAAGACTALSAGGNCNWMVAGRENHPANCVTWFQAEAYCGWVDGGTKRLPTEAEWEKAARSTDAREYPWGDAPAPSCTHVVMHDAGAGGSGCGMGSTWEVGSRPLGDSPYGAHDMAGNVWEWVADWYASGYDAMETDNPTGPGMGASRVLRGGSWGSSNTNLFRAPNRYSFNPANDNSVVGFRCARTPPAAP